jgi:hypothetical protein
MELWGNSSNRDIFPLQMAIIRIMAGAQPTI